MKKIIGSVIISSLLLMALVSVASADSVRIFSILGNSKNLNGYTSPEGVTFTMLNGYADSAMISGDYLSLSGGNNVFTKFAATKDEAPLLVESGKFILGTEARMSSGSCTFTFGRGDSIKFTQSGLTYHGELIEVPFNSGIAVEFSPEGGIVTADNLNPKEFAFDLTGGALSQFGFTCYGRYNKQGSIGQFKKMTLYGEVVEVAPVVEVDPLSLIDNDGDGIMDDVDQCSFTAGVPEYNGCPAPEPTATVAPTELPISEPTPVEPNLLQDLDIKAAVEAAIDEAYATREANNPQLTEAEWMEAALAMLRKDLESDNIALTDEIIAFRLRLAELDLLAATQATINEEAARKATEQAAKDAEQDEKLSFLDRAFNTLKGIVDSIPFIGKGNEKEKNTDTATKTPIESEVAKLDVISLAPVTLEVIEDSPVTVGAPVQDSPPVDTSNMSQEEVLNLILSRLDRIDSRLSGIDSRLDGLESNLSILNRNQLRLIEKQDQVISAINALIQDVGFLLEKWNTGVGQVTPKQHNT